MVVDGDYHIHQAVLTFSHTYLPVHSSKEVEVVVVVGGDYLGARLNRNSCLAHVREVISEILFFQLFVTHVYM